MHAIAVCLAVMVASCHSSGWSIAGRRSSHFDKNANKLAAEAMEVVTVVLGSSGSSQVSNMCGTGSMVTVATAIVVAVSAL